MAGGASSLGWTVRDNVAAAARPATIAAIRAGAPQGADTYGAYPGIDISRNRFTAPSTSAMFQSMYRAAT